MEYRQEWEAVRKRCFFLAKKSSFLTKKRFCYMYISGEDCVSHGKNAGGILEKKYIEKMGQ